MNDKLRRLVHAYQIADTDSARAWEKARSLIRLTMRVTSRIHAIRLRTRVIASNR